MVRTLKDRLRHTLLFEMIALAIVAVGGSWLLNRPVGTIGTLGLMFSALAMGWNFVFNWLFDLWDGKYRAFAHRGFVVRAVHATLFELGMVVAGVFLVAWWLDISYWHAFIIDIGFSAFFLFYAYAFNWTYDQFFPIPRAA